MREASLALLAAVLALPGAARAEDSGAEPKLTLLSPGRPPLKALRYRAKAGQRGTMTVSMDASTSMSMGGEAMPAQAAPQIRYTATYHVSEVTPAGDIRFDFDMGDFQVEERPSVPPAVLEAMRATFADLKGLRGRAVLTTRGVTREAEVEIPATAPRQVHAMRESLQQSMRQLSAPLPAEPVGVGARWETKYRLTMGGLTAEQKGQTELTSLDGDKGTLAVTFTQTAGPQPLPSDDMPPGARADLVSLSTTGEGENEFDLTRLVPTAARVKAKTQMKTRIQMGEQEPRDLETTMDMTLSMTGR